MPAISARCRSRSPGRSVFSWWKKWGIQVVGWKSRGASIQR